MRYGFYLFIDEAGDEGTARVRPIDAEGASEFFVLCGLLIRTTKYDEIKSAVQHIKTRLELRSHETIHFSDLSEEQQDAAVAEVAKLRVGLIAVVSNKRNMRGYKNVRCEATRYEIVRGRKRPQSHNWFYNGLFRYMLERASAECFRWSEQAYGQHLPIKVIFSRRRDFSYSQTVSYLYKLQVARHDKSYFNNKGTINWSVVSLRGIESARPRNEPGLQLADCAASAIFRGVDENWFGKARPDFLDQLSPRFIRITQSPRDYGFKLLPDNFARPLSESQRIGLRKLGYTFPQVPLAAGR